MRKQAQPPLFGDAIAAFRAAPSSVSDRTRAEYTVNLRRLLRPAMDRRLTQITGADVDALFAAIEAGRSVNVLRQTRAAWICFRAYCVSRDWALPPQGRIVTERWLRAGSAEIPAVALSPLSEGVDGASGGKGARKGAQGPPLDEGMVNLICLIQASELTEKKRHADLGITLGLVWDEMQVYKVKGGGESLTLENPQRGCGQGYDPGSEIGLAILDWHERQGRPTTGPVFVDAEGKKLTILAAVSAIKATGRSPWTGL